MYLNQRKLFSECVNAGCRDTSDDSKLAKLTSFQSDIKQCLIERSQSIRAQEGQIISYPQAKSLGCYFANFIFLLGIVNKTMEGKGERSREN